VGAGLALLDDQQVGVDLGIEGDDRMLGRQRLGQLGREGLREGRRPVARWGFGVERRLALAAG
jgi:hypothetical protein